MFQRFANSYALVKQSWSILKKDKEILVFPVLSGITSMVVAASFIVPFFFLGLHGGTGSHSARDVQPFWYVLTFAFYLVTYFVTIFFNVGVMHCAAKRMDGGDPTVADGFNGAFSNIGAIFAWSLVSATVGMVLKAIEQRGEIVTRIVASIFGIAWTLLTFFVVPVMIFEGAGVKQGISRSAELFKKAWGEQLVGSGGIGLFMGVLGLAGLIPVVVGIWFLTLGAAGIGIGFVLFAAAIAYWISLSVVGAALQGIFSVALYRYAATGIVPSDYSQELIASHWQRR